MAVGTRYLVGRKEELGALLELLDDAAGLPAAAVVAGEAGIGKTALWLATIEEARARGYLVLSCRPSEAEAGFSFAGLGDLVGGVLADVLPALPGPQRRALEVALALSDPDGGTEESVVAFGFLNALRRLAETSRILVAVDDLQWLDEPSVALLRYALARLEGEPVAAMLTVRGNVPSWLRRDDRVLELALGPLTVGALHELLRTRVGPLPRPVLLRIRETSGGNPFFALELARALQRRGGRIEPGRVLPLPGTLESLVHERLETLTPEAEEACRVVAAASAPTVELVELASHSGRAGLEDAFAAGVLERDGDRVFLTHPLLASAIAGRMPVEARRSLHERLADLAADAETRGRDTWRSSPPGRTPGWPTPSRPRPGGRAREAQPRRPPSSPSRRSRSRRPTTSRLRGERSWRPTSTSRPGTSAVRSRSSRRRSTTRPLVRPGRRS